MYADNTVVFDAKKVATEVLSMDPEVAIRLLTAAKKKKSYCAL